MDPILERLRCGDKTACIFPIVRGRQVDGKERACNANTGVANAAVVRAHREAVERAVQTNNPQVIYGAVADFAHAMACGHHKALACNNDLYACRARLYIERELVPALQGLHPSNHHPTGSLTPPRHVHQFPGPHHPVAVEPFPQHLSGGAPMTPFGSDASWQASAPSSSSTEPSSEPRPLRAAPAFAPGFAFAPSSVVDQYVREADLERREMLSSSTAVLWQLPEQSSIDAPAWNGGHTSSCQYQGP